MRAMSILNFKGGVGKTSLVENLGHALAIAGKRVLIIDADRQGNTSMTLLADNAIPTLTNVLKGQVPLAAAIKQARANLSIVPSDTNLDEASAHLTGRRSAYYLLRKEVQALTDYEYILIRDHAGSFTPTMEACLLASREMLIPCELEPYAVQGLFNMFAKLEDALPDHG